MGNSHAREMRMAAKSSNADFIGKIDKKAGSILYFFCSFGVILGEVDLNKINLKLDSL